MSNGKEETSTFEMETRKNLDGILQAISGLAQDFNQRFDKIEAEQIEIRKEFNQRFDKVEQRLDKLDQRLDKVEANQLESKIFTELQFEAIRKGIVQNYKEIIQVQRETAENRAAIATTKSVMSELNERVFLLTRATERSF